MIIESNSVIDFQALDLKHFYRKIEALFQSLDAPANSAKFAPAFAAAFYDQLATSLAVTSIILYERVDGRTVPSDIWGAPAELSEALDIDCKCGEDSPWLGEIMKRKAALLHISNVCSHRVLFLTSQEMDTVPGFASYFFSTFSALQFALQQNHKRLELQDVVEQARTIQMSLLPAKNPEFADFDIASISIPARRVGGDVFDFQRLSDDTLALMIADAAGHGLAAALQARDVVTGVRMGVASAMEMTEMVERLNHVIHQSGLTTRFASLIVGRLSANGKFEYVNAGHPRPLLACVNGITQLNHCGLILGPQPDYRYTSGEIEIPRGSAMLLYTDGLIEHQGKEGTEFGLESLKSWMDDWRGAPAAMALQGLLHRLNDFGQGKPFYDDVTMIYIGRP